MCRSEAGLVLDTGRVPRAPSPRPTPSAARGARGHRLRGPCLLRHPSRLAGEARPAWGSDVNLLGRPARRPVQGGAAPGFSVPSRTGRVLSLVLQGGGTLLGPHPQPQGAQGLEGTPTQLGVPSMYWAEVQDAGPHPAHSWSVESRGLSRDGQGHQGHRCLCASRAEPAGEVGRTPQPSGHCSPPGSPLALKLRARATSTVQTARNALTWTWLKPYDPCDTQDCLGRPDAAPGWSPVTPAPCPHAPVLPVRLAVGPTRPAGGSPALPPACLLAAHSRLHLLVQFLPAAGPWHSCF